MGSKTDNNEGRQSCAKLAIDSVALHRQSKMQKIQCQQEGPCRGNLVPSISSHRCNPNPRLTSKKIFGNQDLESQSTPIVANKNFKIVKERNVPEDVELIHECEFGESTSPEGAHSEEKEDEDVLPMIIDTRDHAEIVDCATSDSVCDELTNPSMLSKPCPSTNEHSIKAFCPFRKPQKGCMKGSEGSQESPPISRKRPPTGTPGETLEILLPGYSAPIERRRSITFDEKIDIQNIEPIRLLASGGSKSLWYQENEYETIKFKTLALLDRVDHSSGIIEGKKYCTRGLEKFMTPEETEVKKHQAWDSVLNEQFLQRKDGEFDEESVANIYMYSTKRSRKQAFQRASLDAVASEAYLKTTFRRQSSSDDCETQSNSNRRVSM